MTETDDLLREIVAESRVQTMHLADIKSCLEDVATKDDIAHASLLATNESKLQRREHYQILSKAGNGTKDKLLQLTVIALIVLAGATSAVSLWLKTSGG